MNRKRYLLKAQGPDYDATLLAITVFMREMKGRKSGVIVVPSFNAVKGTVLETVLGERLTARFFIDRQITLSDGGKMQLCSHATLKNFRNEEVYLLLWGTQNMLEDVEKLHSWEALVELGWLPKDYSYWGEKYKPEVIFP